MTDAIAKYIQCVHLQTATLTALGKFAKPVTPGGGALSFLCARIQEIGNEVGTVKQKNFKSPPNHLQVVIDSLNMFNYPFYSLEDLEDVIKDTCSQIDFYGNKVLRENKPEHEAWYNSFKDLNQAILSFVLKNKEHMHFKGSEDFDGAQAWFESVQTAAMKGEAPSAAAPSQATGSVQQKVAAPAQPQAQAAPQASGSLADQYRTDVLSKRQSVLDATAALNVAQVTKAVNQFFELIDHQCRVFAMQKTHKKPADFKPFFAKIQEISADVEKVKNKDMKAPVAHMSLVLDSLALFGSFSFVDGEESKEYYKEMVQVLPCHGNKILKMDKPEHTTWSNTYIEFCNAHYNFIIKNWKAVLDWSGSQDNHEDALKSAVSASAPVAEAPKAEEKKEAPKPAAPVKKAPVKKEPTKKFANRMWTFENFENETIRLEGAEQVDKNFVYNFFSCKNCTIIIIGKIKNIQLEGCQKIELHVDTVVSEVSLMNCKVIKAFGKEALKTLTIENTSEVHLWLNSKTKICKVFSTCGRSIFMHFPKTGASDEDLDTYLSMPVAETYETVIQNDEIVTTPAEALE